MQGMLTHSFQRMWFSTHSIHNCTVMQSRNTTQTLRCQPPKSDPFGTYAQSRCAATRSRVKIQGGLGFQDIDYRSYDKNVPCGDLSDLMCFCSFLARDRPHLLSSIGACAISKTVALACAPTLYIARSNLPRWTIITCKAT